MRHNRTLLYFLSFKTALQKRILDGQRHKSESHSRLQGVSSIELSQSPWQLYPESSLGRTKVVGTFAGGATWHGMAWHLSCNPFTGLCHCPSQALGLCCESVPMGKAMASGVP